MLAKRHRGRNYHGELCSIYRCNKKAFARGYCVNHYTKYRNPDKKCTLDVCGRPHFAKGLCHNCYAASLRGGYKTKPCPVHGCKRNTRQDICGKHKKVIRDGLVIIGPRISSNWKGALYGYPNHGKMKRARRMKMEQTGGVCEDCGIKKKIMNIHHIDKSKDNHALENLRLLCPKCHCKYHPWSERVEKILSHSPKYEIIQVWYRQEFVTLCQRCQQ